MRRWNGYVSDYRSIYGWLKGGLPRVPVCLPSGLTIQQPDHTHQWQSFAHMSQIRRGLEREVGYGIKEKQAMAAFKWFTKLPSPVLGRSLLSDLHQWPPAPWLTQPSRLPRRQRRQINEFTWINAMQWQCRHGSPRNDQPKGGICSFCWWMKWSIGYHNGAVLLGQGSNSVSP